MAICLNLCFVRMQVRCKMKKNASFQVIFQNQLLLGSSLQTMKLFQITNCIQMFDILLVLRCKPVMQPWATVVFSELVTLHKRCVASGLQVLLDADCMSSAASKCSKALKSTWHHTCMHYFMVWTHLDSLWGVLSRTSCQRRSVCTWLSHRRSTPWLVLL